MMARRFFVVFGGAALLWAAFFGVHAGMGEGGGFAAPCPFMAHETAMCPIAALNHLSGWQRLFIATVDLAGVALLLAFAFIILRRAAVFSAGKEVLALRATAGVPEARLFDYLRLAFRVGELHPKLYA